MPNYLHRTTKTQLVSVAEADLPNPVGEYILDPVLPDAPAKYWIVSGDSVTLMDQVARDVVDAAEKAIQETAEIDSYDNPLVQVLLTSINALETKAGISPTTMDAAKAEAKAKLGN